MRDIRFRKDAPKGMIYGGDDRYWAALREGSTLEVPNLFGNEAEPQIALASEFSKLRRDRALAKAFLRALDGVVTVRNQLSPAYRRLFNRERG